MRASLFVACAFSVAFIAACQPASSPQSADAPAEQTVQTPAASPAAAPTLPCGVLAQRDWEAEQSGSSLTVSGEIDLGTPGYGVSLARDDSEAQGATSTTLILQLRAPTGQQTQVVTPHPVRYFGPARGQYESVHIICDGAELTTVAVTH